MLLDRTVGYREPASDTGVRTPLGHEPEDLVFARCEPVERIVPPARGYQLLDQARIDDRSTSRDALDRFDELVHVGHPALEQISDPLSACEQLHRIFDLDVG